MSIHRNSDQLTSCLKSVFTLSQNWFKKIFQVFILQQLLFYPLLAFSSEPCAGTPAPNVVSAVAAAKNSIIQEILATDVEAVKRRYLGDHFRETSPLALIPGAVDSSAVPVRMMSANFEHFLPEKYDPAVWEGKMTAFGKTIFVQKPDFIVALEMYEEGLKDFSAKVLNDLGYEYLFDKEGGKPMFGHVMGVGFMYNPKKFTVVSTESIPVDVPAAVEHTRNIFRITLQMNIGGPPLIVYGIHFKSPMILQHPIPNPGGKPITTSNMLRLHQMRILKTRVEQDIAAGHQVMAMGDFNTPFALKEFVDPDHLDTGEYDVGDNEKWMIWSASPMRDLIAAGTGVDALSGIPGYSHVYRKHGSKLDHIMVFPSTAQAAPAQTADFAMAQIRERMYMRYPWHLQPKTGYPAKDVVSDHLPLFAEVLLVPKR